MTDARTITLALGGRWRGRHGYACCPAHDDRAPSLSLADGADGRLLAHCHAGCDWAAILDALCARGLAEGEGHGFVPGPAAEARARAETMRDLARRAGQATTCWAEAGPVAGTPAEAYLARRGIPAEARVGAAGALRYHPAAWHGATARRLPALVARIDGAEAFAVHRTYLTPEGARADVPGAKAMLGPVKGGAVRLGGAGRVLAVAEGIETTLSLLFFLGRPVQLWAALSAGGMAALRLPPLVAGAKLIVAVDGDPAGRGAGRALAQRATALGWCVNLADPGEGRDFNDVLTGRAAA